MRRFWPSALLLPLPLALAASPDEDYARGLAALAAKDAAGAEAALEACTQAAPQREDCWWELGWARWTQGDWAGVVAAWEQVHRLNPTRDELARYLPTAQGNLEVQRLIAEAARRAPAQLPPPPPGAKLRLRAVGDVMMGSDFPEPMLPEADGTTYLGAVAGLLRDADLTFVNLEGPLCDSGTTNKCRPGSNCYAFRTPTRYAPYLAEAGVDLASTANNHANDFGDSCRLETEAALAPLNIAFSGRPGTVARVQSQGLKVAMIGFHTSDLCHNLNDTDTARALVAALAAEHDVVIVSFHGGAEGSKALHVPAGREQFYGEDRGDLRLFTHAVVDAGADLVLGHGPHVLRGMEVYQGRLIAYSLGNFATYGRFNLSGWLGVGAVLEVELDGQGRFLGGQLLSTTQVGDGVPQPDPEGRAAGLVRQLSEEDFPQTGVVVDQQGRIGAR